MKLQFWLGLFALASASEDANPYLFQVEGQRHLDREFDQRKDALTNTVPDWMDSEVFLEAPLVKNDAIDTTKIEDHVKDRLTASKNHLAESLRNSTNSVNASLHNLKTCDGVKKEVLNLLSKFPSSDGKSKNLKDETLKDLNKMFVTKITEPIPMTLAPDINDKSCLPMDIKVKIDKPNMVFSLTGLKLNFTGLHGVGHINKDKKSGKWKLAMTIG